MSAEAAQPILEQCSTLRFEWGGGGVIPDIPSAVYRSVPPSGCAPISPPSTPKPSPMTPPQNRCGAARVSLTCRQYVRLVAIFATLESSKVLLVLILILVAPRHRKLYFSLFLQDECLDVCRLGTAGRAIVPVKLPLGGPELLRDCCPWADCNLHLTYLGHRYPMSAAPTAPLFDPPLALQRHALVAGTPCCPVSMWPLSV